MANKDSPSLFVSLRKENRFTITPSEQKYFLGLIKSFLFSALTIFFLYLLGLILYKFPLNNDGIYKTLVDNCLQITGFLAVGQLLLYVIYGIIIWIIECFKEQKIKWQK